MGGTIMEDTRQKEGKHGGKHAWWEAHGINVVRRKLDTGDYSAEGSNVLVDTKRSVAEIAQNIGGRGHDRFKRECVRAQEGGYRLVVLVENAHGYTCIKNVAGWTNTHCRACAMFRARRCNPHKVGKCAKHGTAAPIQGGRLSKAMETMEARYGVRFMFCHPRDAARKVCELLGVDYGQ